MVVLKSVYKCKRDRRRKSRLKRWNRPRRLHVARREFTILPTRKTLTYAEAQKFVDVVHGGHVQRLNISDCIDIETSKELIEAIEKEQDNAYQEKVDSPTRNKFEPICKCIELNTASTNIKKTVSFKLTQAYLRCFEKTPEELDDEVEYDVDEEDIAWLKLLNNHRKLNKLLPLSLDSLEFVLDRLEKKAHSLTTSASQPPESGVVEGVATDSRSVLKQSCCVCRKDHSSATNCILMCSCCGLSTHQDCYGVPYYPDGDWLCRKCLKSPHTPVKCCLCPRSLKDKDGPTAMKQTDDGRWVHILCALFIPEVSFGSNVYLEPVERVDKVPKWRSDLKCQGCNRVGQGACLGCQAPGCTRSYHALCAIKKGCYLRLVGSEASGPEADSGKLFSSKRTGDRRTRVFFCADHVHLSSPDNDSKLYEGSKGQGSLLTTRKDPNSSLLHTLDGNCVMSPSKAIKKQKPQRRPRKGIHSTESAVIRVVGSDCPVSLSTPIAVPNLSQDSLSSISSHLAVRDRQQLMLRIHRYWLLKRHSRKGLPLIQRLQQILLIHRILQLRPTPSTSPTLDGESTGRLKKLRQDYEKVRLLLELIRKREKLKVELLKMRETVIELLLQPLGRLLRHTLEQLQTKDSIGLFALPVTEEEAPGYRSVVRTPMDYSTMHEKVRNQQYKSVGELEEDFELMMNNCSQFNGTDSELHKIALKHKKQCSVILESARRMSERADYCSTTGLHSESKRSVAVHESEEDGVVGEDETAEMKLKLEELHKKLDVLLVVKSKGTYQQERQLRKEISLTKRRLTLATQRGADRVTPKVLPPADKKDGRISGKREICRSPEEEFASDSTIIEKSLVHDGACRSSKRVCPSSGATELLSSPASSDETVITNKSLTSSTVKRRRNRLTSNTNIIRSKQCHSTSKCKRQTDPSNSSSPSETLSSGSHPDENKAPSREGVPRMRLRSSASLQFAVETCGSLSRESNSKHEPKSLNRVLQTKDVSQADDGHSAPRRIIRGSRRVLSKAKVKKNRQTNQPPCSTEVFDDATASPREEDVKVESVKSPPAPDATSGGSDPMFARQSDSESSKLKCKCVENDIKVDKLATSPVVLMEKSVVSKNRPTEEIDSSYESSYSIDSMEDKKEHQGLSPQTDSCDRCSPPQIFYELEDKLADKSSWSSGVCSKDADDLCTALSPGDIVWAKTKGYPWYPALVVVSDCLPPDRPSQFFKNIVPPEAVLSLRSKFTTPVNLIRFFDKRKNWQWLPRNKLDLLGVDAGLDEERIGCIRGSNLKWDVKRAYESALHRRRSKALDGLRSVKDDSPEDERSGTSVRPATPRSTSSHQQHDRPTIRRSRLPDSLLKSRGEEFSEQPVLNCSQQFLTSSFPQEKMEVDSNLVLPQQPKMLSCSL